MHKISEPSILYFGTPVILISSLNENNTYNLAPISSVFWLGWRCVIGISAESQTTKNVVRNGECVINLPSEDQSENINNLVFTTGRDPVPEGKRKRGYYFEPSKFEKAELTPISGDMVASPMVEECPVQLEAIVSDIHPLAEKDPKMKGRILIIELRIVRIHIEESILMEGDDNRVDPDKWKPLIMSFQKFYGFGKEINYSKLSNIPEALYKTSDIEKSRKEF